MATHLIVDVSGWYGGAGASLQPVVPTRRLDTRLGQGGYGRLGAGQSITLPLAGRDGIPANAVAVRVNLTAVGPVPEVTHRSIGGVHDREQAVAVAVAAQIEYVVAATIPSGQPELFT